MIQIVPHLRPARCGVSDHALALACALQDRHGVETTFVLLNAQITSEVPFPQVACQPSELLATCSRLSTVTMSPILAHYSGYGYSPDGAPHAVATALNQLKDRSDFRLAVYFHEIFASGKPWSSAFWQSTRQKAVARSIANSCHLVMTNLDRHFAWLQDATSSNPPTFLRKLSIFSNTGEPSDHDAPAERQNVLLVFGLPGSRVRSYRQLRELESMFAPLGITEIFDVGPECAVPARLGECPVTRLGILSNHALHELLATVRYGFVPHPPHYMAKSTILASLCSMGSIPLVAQTFHGSIDGLEDGLNILSARYAASLPSGAQAQVAARARHWYDEHNLAKHATTYAQLLLS